MPDVTMYAFGSRGPVQTTYSGLVVPAPGSNTVSVDIRDIATMTREGYTLTGGANNLGATADPTASSDSSQGYGPGSVWINTAYPRVWICNSGVVGAASWTLLFQHPA
jgi:hypothetical protein